MRTTRSFALMTLTTLALGLGSSWAAAGEPTPRTYSPAQVATIMKMREWGDGLSDVAKVVGGSRKDVKAAEQAEKSRRRASRAPGGREAIATSGRSQVVFASR